ncbi:WXG100 family type VII secretion target [Actinoplanes sp. RD1]|uniref:WXG100 family type VII secretion target n=1 Tax=Actinoplanes sp. RD1 TaxID=3064538 RepID=UPI002741069C|nr:WXG100 family type VII secretion target [Actinoplanes sp. RD1]
MDHILVTPEMISDAAVSCDNTAAEIDAELASVRKFVVNLEALWHGTAANNFSNVTYDFDTCGRNLHNALTGIAAGLRRTSTNYVEAETANVSTLTAVDSATRGFPVANL